MYTYIYIYTLAMLEDGWMDGWIEKWIDNPGILLGMQSLHEPEME